MCFKEKRITILLIFVLLTFVSSMMHAQPNPQDGWNFKYKDFPIGAWWGPYASDEEIQLYKDAGFNIIMTGRYMNNDKLDLTEEMVTGHLDLAQKHNLSAMFDPYNNYTWSDDPTEIQWNPVGVEDLKWIINKFGSHPALIGILIGDDQSRATPQLIAATNYMRTNSPELMPWICQNNFDPVALVQLGNPIADWQMYPTLYNMDHTATGQMQIYCNQLNLLYKRCDAYNLIMWPMFNVVYVDSDNIVRFQVYSSIAYASQGIWYFHYDGGLRGGGTEVYNTYYPAAEANKRVAAWSPMLLGRKSGGVFNTGWKIDNAMNPDSGKYVTEMSDKLLVGILLKDEEYPLAMVVDKRVSKEWESIPPREVTVKFAKSIEKIYVLEGDSVVNSVYGNEITLQIKAGGGQLLQLIDPVEGIRKDFYLSQNYPNPFNSQTTISFDLYQKEHVRLEIFNLLGQRIQTLVNKEMLLGKHKIIWHALDGKGSKMSSGIYIYKLTIGNETKANRMVLIR